MKFSYTAINSDYKRVNGTISSEDEKVAKAELHKMGLSVLSIQEESTDSRDTEKNAEEEAIETFWFFVQDESGKKSAGTIEAKEPESALQRLNAEYQLEVLALCSAAVAESEREEVGRKQVEELEKKMAALNIVPLHHTLQKTPDEEKTVAVNKAFEANKKQILEEVNAVIEKAEELMQKHKENISGSEFEEIKKNVDTLARMKLSNNLVYIQKLSEDLFDNIHSVLLRYEAGSSPREGISNVRKKSTANETEEMWSEAQNNAMHEKAVKNAFTLGQLQSISQRMSRLLSKKKILKPLETPAAGSLEVSGADSSASVGSLLVGVLFARSSIARKAKWQALKNALKKKPAEENGSESEFPLQTSSLVLEELRGFAAWLLGFYVLFFFFTEYALLKGFSPAIPFLQSLFATSFLLLFAAFIFLLSLNLELWKYLSKYSTRKYIMLTITVVCSALIYGLYSINI